jgi:hypothetical protein
MPVHCDLDKLSDHIPGEEQVIMLLDNTEQNIPSVPFGHLIEELHTDPVAYRKLSDKLNCFFRR